MTKVERPKPLGQLHRQRSSISTPPETAVILTAFPQVLSSGSDKRGPVLLLAMARGELARDVQPPVRVGSAFLEGTKMDYVSTQARSSALKRAHIDASDDSDENYCHDCGIPFSRPYTFRRHIRDVHESTSEWRCEHQSCGRSFKRKDILDRHMDTQHGSGKAVCPACSNSVRKDGLSEHLATRACRKARARKSERSRLYQQPLCTLSEHDEVGSTNHPWSDDAALPRQDDSEDQYMLPVFTPEPDSWEDRPVITAEFAGGEDAMQVEEPSSRELSISINERGVGATSSTSPGDLPASRAPCTPYIVADSPLPAALNVTLDELFLLDDTDAVELAEEVEERRLALEKTVAKASSGQQTRGPREHDHSPLKVAGARESYEMGVGSPCALCAKNLGSNLQSVHDHARYHIQSYDRPSLTCKTCKIEFAFEIDMKLHLSKQQTWALSRELPPTPVDDQSDWVAVACVEAREAFIGLLRSWETLQLHWYLASINKLFARYDEHDGRYRSNTISILHPPVKRKTSRFYTESRSSYTGDRSMNAISMDSLIQKFKTKLPATGTDISTPADTERSLGDERTVRKNLVQSCFNNLYYATNESVESFHSALHQFRMTHRGSVIYQTILEKVLRQACHEGKVDIVRILLDFGVDIDALSSSGYNALACAIMQSQSEVVKFLVGQGANTRHTGRKAKSALQYAYQTKLHDIIPSILQQGAEVDETDFQGDTLLIGAAGDGHLEVATNLLDAGASIDRPSPVSSRQALGWAALGGHAQLVQLLLDYGAPIDAQNDLGETALMTASYWGFTSIVEILLKHGADVSMVDRSGRHAFQLARGSKIEEMRKLLDDDAKGFMEVCAS